ncbi:MAG TPA: hypothetical protein VG982_02175 [Candidatus Paceibacterota bacterium]|nr:hypothetical protein [Candidatus Paceibacterota bacterium]
MKKIIISIIAVFAFAVFMPANFAHAGNGQACQPTDFTADEYTLQSGEGTILHWDSVGCDSASIVPADYPGDRPPYDSISTGAIFRSTTYTLTVYDAQGNIGGQRFLTINIEDNNTNDGNGGGNSDCQIDNFDADDTSISDGDSTRLRWSTSDCDRAKILPDVGTVSLDGSESVDPNDDTTYTLYAYDDNGNLADTDTVRISVDNNNNNNDCQIDSFYADDTSINDGDSTDLHWRTTDCDRVKILPDVGTVSLDGSESVDPNDDTTYTLYGYDSNGNLDDTDTVRINVDNGGGTTINTSNQPQAITTVASILSTSSAQLNGIAVPNTTSGSSKGWFEWGSNTALGIRTATQTIPSNLTSNYYSAVINGLAPGTVYYYRAVVQTNRGTAYGDIVPFRTQSISTPPSTTTTTKTTTIRNVVVANSAPSLLALKVESDSDRMCVNGEVNYTITYQNVSKETLDDAVLQITHQKELTFVSSSRGNYDVTDRTITVDLGTLDPGESGTMFVRGTVNNSAQTGALSVITASVVYTNTLTKAQENAIAYSLVSIANDCPNVLGASAFGFGFLPHTLIQWLFLILIILALIVLGRHLYGQRKKEAEKTS